jgi:hypothetical protein
MSSSTLLSPSRSGLQHPAREERDRLGLVQLHSARRSSRATIPATAGNSFSWSEGDPGDPLLRTLGARRFNLVADRFDYRVYARDRACA